MSIKIISICLFIICMLSGCDNSVDGPLYRYGVLIGSKCEPEYTLMSIGDRIGPNTVFGTYGDEFGIIHVFWDGKISGVFDRGGVILMSNGGHLLIEGENHQELFVLVIERIGNDEFVLVKKNRIPIGEINGLSLTLPLVHE